MVSLDPELFELFLVLTSRRHPIGSQLALTSARKNWKPHFSSMTLETCSCAQNVHLEILFPTNMKSLSFHYRRLVKIRSKSCYPDSNSYFFFNNCKVVFFKLQLNVSSKRLKLETSGCVHLKELSFQRSNTF